MSDSYIFNLQIHFCTTKAKMKPTIFFHHTKIIRLEKSKIENGSMHIFTFLSYIQLCL